MTTNALRPVGWLALIAFAACGGPPVHGEPEDAARALVEAAQAQNAEAIQGLFPSRSQLSEAMLCRAGEGPADRIPRAIEALLGDQEALAQLDAFEGFDGLVRHRVAGPSEDAEGEAHRGCQARVDLVFAEGEAVFKEETPDGTLDERREKVRMIRLGEMGWFFLSL